MVPNNERAGSSRESAGNLFPLLHDDLGLLCLVRLPRHTIYQVAMVSRKWSEFLMSSELYKARRLLGVREEWVIIRDRLRTRVFVPASRDWMVLPRCPVAVYEWSYRRLTIVGLNLFDISWKGFRNDGFVMWKFDTVKCVWSRIPAKPSVKYLLLTFGKYAYFAGDGTQDATLLMFRGLRKLKSLERYDSETNLWEQLPEMTHSRRQCSWFVKDGKFHVMGGLDVEDNHITSAEAYDPIEGKWTVIEGMWPCEFGSCGGLFCPNKVAVLSNQLYAFDIRSYRVMFYNWEESVWQMLEKIPLALEAYIDRGSYLSFTAVGDELFFIAVEWNSLLLYAFRPTRVQGNEAWRIVADLPDQVTHSTDCHSTDCHSTGCAVMSG